ncbi:DEAD/DEAH box helicase [Pseudomonas sp. GW704-F3]|uniref:DEAD/DEAH box helicase n=5 Tax=Pseudomonas TaxID=286 RepID=UPI000C8778D5|nr:MULTISPECIES: DEAD/DEAH box helicase [unclassified Pseudomonas]PMU88373.1 DEAD/DEAH box helicase [Pseudomonas sp. GW704-F3]PMU90350.1 DEAD/DEAH box helicase [Pseudomonas sp. GW704-F5]PMV27624.1 DEAD/DEAH box helicase [Pseudomonas sp. GW704-F2]
MKPERASRVLLGVTRSKAKMYEYNIPDEHHIQTTSDPSQLLILSIATLGEICSAINSIGTSKERLAELKSDLQFSAQFFDSYLQSKLDEDLDPYLMLLASSSYYLCDLPGSSSVLIRKLPLSCPYLDASNLEDLLHWLLKGNFTTPFTDAREKYRINILGLSSAILAYYNSGEGFSSVESELCKLRAKAYDIGSDRELLFADIICAITSFRIRNSSWTLLPLYSGLAKDSWMEYLKKDSSIKELWPSQRILGEQGVLRSTSAIIQMPTSAGKTKSIEIIIRSAFLSARASLAVVVAPFKALCQEIRSELVKNFEGELISIDGVSDVPQMDFTDFNLDGFLDLDFTSIETDSILVLTPEKLMYVLRQSPDLAERIGVVIYDEGHQFDSGPRGVTYELLLASLKSLIPKETQTILISAVINNSQKIGDWLNGEDGINIDGSNILSTYRTVAFASWKDSLGRLEFVEQENTDEKTFFVPRVIEKYKLLPKARERNEKFFPDKTDGKSIATFLGLKLVPNGSVAIFCGVKASVSTLSKLAVEVYSRDMPIPSPRSYSDEAEVEKLSNLHLIHLGKTSDVTKCSHLGVYCHSSNTPQGLRVAIEYAMQKSLIKFIICTSTLAQGVNLPIRYLLVTSIYQAGKMIKVRDFHNLIGRAGRSGMYTEGSIIFADPDVFDMKSSSDGRWKWAAFKKILNFENSEPCTSSILNILAPIASDDGKSYLNIDAVAYLEYYLKSPKELLKHLIEFAKNNSKLKFTVEGVLDQAEKKANIIASIEGYLLAHWDDTKQVFGEDGAVHLAQQTLAYSLSSEEDRKTIISIFDLIAKNIEIYCPLEIERRAFGRTLFGLTQAQTIKEWAVSNIKVLEECTDEAQALDILWPFIYSQSKSKDLNKIDSPDNLRSFVSEWIKGSPYHALSSYLTLSGAKYIWGTKRRVITNEHTISACESGIAYDGTLILGSIIELLKLIKPEIDQQLLDNLSLLQKKLRYGLSSSDEISFYELGVSDRHISQALAKVLPQSNESLKVRIKNSGEALTKCVIEFPSYYSDFLGRLLFEN